MIENVPDFVSDSYGSEKLKKEYMFDDGVTPQQPDELTTSINNA